MKRILDSMKTVLLEGLFANDRRIPAAVLAVFVLFLAIPSRASAVDYGGVGGRPANPRPDNPRTESIFVEKLAPGESVEEGVRVINNTPERKTIMVYGVDSVVSSGGAFACAQQNDAKIDVGAWMTLAKSEVTLDSLTNEVVPFTIRAPQNAGAGEHNGCIILQEKKGPVKEQINQQTGAMLSFRTGLRVAVLVPGEITRKLEMAGYGVTKSPKSGGGFVLHPKVKNTGNVSIDADVKVVTQYFFGKILGEEGGQYPVMRGETSEYNFDLKKPFWGGWYKSFATVSYDPNPEAGVGTKSGKSLAVLKSPAVWFFSPPAPTAAMIEVLVLLLVIFGIFLLWISRRRKNWIKQHWVEYSVAAGEDINILADRFGVSWKLLAKANGLKPPYAVKPESKLKVPPQK